MRMSHLLWIKGYSISFPELSRLRLIVLSWVVGFEYRTSSSTATGVKEEVLAGRLTASTTVSFIVMKTAVQLQ